MRQKVCQCHDNWGESHPDCDWLFEPKHGNERYCSACKPVAQRARIRQAVQKFRGMSLEDLVESTDREWLASWIDKTCSHCGLKGVPTFNRFLCYACWTSIESFEIEFHSPRNWIQTGVYEQFSMKQGKNPGHGEVKQYNCKDYTQEQLQAILKGEK